MEFADIYIRQTLLENASKIKDILRDSNAINITSGGGTSILDRVIQVPVSAEALVLNDLDMCRIAIKVNVQTSDKKVLAHTAIADNRPLKITGTCRSELRASYHEASAYITYMMEMVTHKILDDLARELARKEKELIVAEEFVR